MSSPSQVLATLDRQPNLTLTEKEITRLWQWTVAAKENFTGDTGERISVTKAGRPAASSGPDIRGVTLVVDGIRRSGTVEIHQHPADWYQHNHQHDPAFNNVILQVCLHSAADCPARRADGRLIPTISLTDELEDLSFSTSPSRFLQRLQQVKHPCYKHLFRRRLLACLRRAGQCWLYRRVVTLKKLPGERRLWQPLVGALGYTFNHRQFRCLARRLSPKLFYNRLSELDRPMELEAWLLGKAGWFPQLSSSKINRSIYNRRRCWRENLATEEPLIKTPSFWRLGGVRPQSYPYRRWISFGRATRRLEAPWRQYLLALEESALQAKSLRAFLAQRLLPRFKFPGRNYWRHHYTFSDDRRESVPSPFGKKWLDQLIVNVVIPFFYQRALFNGWSERRRCWEQIFLDYPPVLPNRRTRTIESQCGMEVTWPSVAHQQGAVFLYKRYCQQGRCSECMLNSPRPAQQQLFTSEH